MSCSSIYDDEVFKDANQIIVVFDITHTSTFEKCSEWLDKYAYYSKDINESFMHLAIQFVTLYVGGVDLFVTQNST
jgi:hypothetical protein